MDIVELKNITRIYGSGANSTKALSNINLTIRKGSFTSIIGRSGSGKSTLLNMIGGLDRPTEGSVIIEGHELLPMSDNELTRFRRKRIGFIFQTFNLIPEFTVSENVCLPSYLDSVAPDKEFIEVLLDKLRISNKKEKYPSELSGGEQQRVAVARALSTRPAIVLADEPTGNLDIKSGEMLAELLRYCNRHFEQTILLVTHNIELARTAQRMITLEDGKVTVDFYSEDL